MVGGIAVYGIAGEVIGILFARVRLYFVIRNVKASLSPKPSGEKIGLHLNN